MGRDCVSHTAPSRSMAHSRSCGEPKCTSARRPRRSSARQLGIVQAGQRAGVGLRHPLGSAAGQGTDEQALVPNSPLQDPSRGAVEHEVVRVDRPGHHRLPQPRAGVDDGLVPPPGHGVGGEQHPGHGRVHHALDHHGEGHRRRARSPAPRGRSPRGLSTARPSTGGRQPARHPRRPRSGTCPAGRRSWQTAGLRRSRRTAPRPRASAPSAAYAARTAASMPAGTSASSTSARAFAASGASPPGRRGLSRRGLRCTSASAGDAVASR